MLLKRSALKRKKSFDLQFVPFGSLHNVTVIFVIYTGRYKICYIITLSYYWELFVLWIKKAFIRIQHNLILLYMIIFLFVK